MTIQIIPPHNGHSHSVSVWVDESTDWDTAISLGCPETPNSYDIWRVGNSYPWQLGVKPRKAEIILARFDSDAESAKRWWEFNNLEFATPREIFAIGQQRPDLPREFNNAHSLTQIGTLQECRLAGRRHIPVVWWNRGAREAFLCPPWCNFGIWFAFKTSLQDELIAA